MEPNLLVSYNPNAGYFSGKAEIHNLLVKFGDQKEEMELMVPGIIGVKTKLDARNLIEDLRERYVSDPNVLSATLKWVPADYWCDATVDVIVKTVKEEVKDMFLRDDVYAIEVINHKSDLHHEQIIEAIVPWLKGKVDLEHPQKILRIELFDKQASVTLLLPKNIFSAG
ncbi:Uncharacterised protein [uncultured archaeon]|nr:Uncharacterised protein [uncultured archaeon]